MCSVYQSLGLWLMVGVTLIVGIAIGSFVSWRTFLLRQWWRRMSLHLKYLHPLVRYARTGLIGMTILGVLAYGWIVH